MPDALPQLADNMSVARAHLPADAVMLTPPICTMGEKAHFTQYDVFATLGNGRHLMMGGDPRLPKMPARPRLADFFRHRFVPMVANHLLQSASLAKKSRPCRRQRCRCDSPGYRRGGAAAAPDCRRRTRHRRSGSSPTQIKFPVATMGINSAKTRSMSSAPTPPRGAGRSGRATRSRYGFRT